MDSKRAFDQEGFTDRVKKWEWDWVNGSETYPDKPVGDPVALSKKLYTRYVALIKDSYQKKMHAF